MIIKYQYHFYGDLSQATGDETCPGDLGDLEDGYFWTGSDIVIAVIESYS